MQSMKAARVPIGWRVYTFHGENLIGVADGFNHIGELAIRREDGSFKYAGPRSSVKVAEPAAGQPQPLENANGKTDADFVLDELRQGPRTTGELLRASFEKRGCGLTVHSRVADL